MLDLEDVNICREITTDQVSVIWNSDLLESDLYPTSKDLEDDSISL